MEHISVRRFGLAFGTTAALLYLGCVLVVASVSREAQIRFFNSLVHGIDVTSIVRTQMPVGQMLLGVVEVFILGWLIGASIASIYNIGVKGSR